MNTHHILVNNAIIVGKHLELDTEVLYVYIIYVSKKPVGAIDSPLSLERTQIQIRIIIYIINYSYAHCFYSA
jgi:predicted nuclease with RNAse H fold